MIYEPETVKGFPEFMPPEADKFEAIKRILEKAFINYGFSPIKTPTIEFDELARSDRLGDEDEAISDRFKLQDKGGRNLSLRHEFTYQLARVFKQHQDLKLPFKRYQIGSVFRDEPTSSNRFREFTQADADIIGNDSLEADAECLALTVDILKQLNIEAEIQLNNRRLVNAILDSVKIEQRQEVMRELDKLDKIGEDTVKTNLKKYADANQILTLFKLLEKDLAFFVKNLFDGAEDIQKVKDLGKLYGYSFTLNPFLMRGLSYYTGNVFEVRVKGDKTSIGGGGRYARVAGKYLGRDVPSIGISFGIERLMPYAKVKVAKTQLMIISINEPKESIRLATKTRSSNIPTILTMEKIGKALEYANAYAVPFVLFVGSDEIKKKKYKLRNMTSGDENMLSETQVIKRLSALTEN